VKCDYFGICGSCRHYEGGYDAQLSWKTASIHEQFAPYFQGDIAIFTSKEEHFRFRSEFKIYHDEGGISYAMNRADKQGVVKISSCSIVSEPIAKLMGPLLEAIRKEEIAQRLFGIDFLSTQSGEVVVSFLYHRALDEEWQVSARRIEAELGIHIIGRSRKQN